MNIPCQKYCIRSISNETQKLEFSKMLFSLLRNYGYDDNMVIGHYSSAMSSSGTMGLISGNNQAIKMYDYHGATLSAYDYLERVSFDDEIKSYRKCYEYCKASIPSVSSLCSICPNRTPKYEERKRYEGSLLKYISSSPEHLHEYLHDIGSTRKKLFYSGVDLAEDIFYKLPVVVPLNSIFFKYIRADSHNYFSGTDPKQCLSDCFDNILPLLLRESLDVQTLHDASPMAIKIQWDKYMEYVLSSDDISYSELKQYFEKKTRSKTASTTIRHIGPGEPNSYNIFDIMGNSPAPEQDTTLNDKDEEKTAQNTHNAVSDMPEAVSPVESEAETVEPIAHTEDKEDNPIAEDIEDGSIVEDGELQSQSDEDGISQKSEGTDRKLSSEQNIAFETVNTTESPSNEIKQEEKPAGNTQYDENRTGHKQSFATNNATGYSLLSMPVMLRAELYDICVGYMEHEQEVLHYLSKHPFLPVELFSDENNEIYFILYISGIPKHILLSLNMIPASFDNILCRNEVCKIMWQPYVMYSICKIKGIPIKNIHSILSMDILLSPKAEHRLYYQIVLYYLSFNSNRSYDRVRSVLSSNVKYSEAFIYGMTAYDAVSYQQEKMLKNISQSQYKYQIYRDEVLGKSYMRSVNLKEDSLLFTCDIKGTLLINTDFECSVKNEGFIVTYSITTGAGTEDLRDFYLHVLAEFAAKGRFRKYNIQLLSLVGDKMVLFTDVFCHEVVTTYLQSYFNRYALKYRYERFEITVDHQRYSPDGIVNIEESEYDLPDSAEDVLDILTTSSEILEVKPDRIKTPNPSSNPAKRQRETYPSKKQPYK